ncbi:hypothetical protein RF11_03744 [Thelohanellus kitauei]|uniref:Uncharacterized protein n=1 Tax=Thelohanellus kitauei TaxID=669202 RepID=A0A0C2JS16_THEKT|nr:hypothetical protein RF11_03744 [Thelohanellus kitauei]
MAWRTFDNFIILMRKWYLTKFSVAEILTTTCNLREKGTKKLFRDLLIVLLFRSNLNRQKPIFLTQNNSICWLFKLEVLNENEGRILWYVNAITIIQKIGLIQQEFVYLSNNLPYVFMMFNIRFLNSREIRHLIELRRLEIIFWVPILRGRMK